MRAYLAVVLAGCTADQVTLPRDAGTCVATAEICNGVDDDCNGSIDEIAECSPPAVIDLQTGRFHSCALFASGEVKCWGTRYESEPHAMLLRPTTIASIEGATMLTGTYDHCVLAGEGAVHCFPFGSDDDAGPSAVPDLPPVVEVAQAIYHACARTANGAVWCWGWNFYGELGREPISETLPAAMVSDLENVDQIATGNFHTCVVGGGSTRCFGDNVSGQLGYAAGGQSGTPVRVSIDEAVKVAAGAFHSCALLRGGSIACWGDNTAGQCSGSSDPSPPVTIEGIEDAADVFTGGYTTCAITNAGEVFCLGANVPDASSDQRAPIRVPALDGAVEIALGPLHGCALFSDGEVKCWGANDYAAVGSESPPIVEAPTPIGIEGATDLVAGEHHACAIAGGRLHCWGAAECFYDQPLGPDLTPAEIPTGGTILRASAGRSHTCAVTTSGTVECFGCNDWGQLSVEPFTETEPVIEVAGLPPIREVTNVDTGSCALAEDGSAWCWGLSTYGAIGDRTGIEVEESTDLTGSRSLASGSEQLCAVRADGQLVCRGSIFALDDYALYGDAETSTVPIEIAGVVDPISVSPGLSSCAVLADGTTMCWGRNRYGQLGDGTTEHRREPTPMAIDDAIQVDTGRHTCVVRANGELACFGANWAGQLGDASIDNASRVVVGTGFSCALLETGSVVCWGWSSGGRLGLGAAPRETSPIRVVGLSADQ